MSSSVAGRLAIVACALCLGACRAERPFDRIVMVTIDTLRADHLGSFGYPIETSPFIDRLASEGVSFKRAYAQSSTTGPSHASMFTGLYPLQHRVRNNGQVLDDRFVTLAEAVGELGFRTAAFVSGMSHFGSSKIAQGFAHYDEPRPDGGWRTPYRPAAPTVDAVVEWLETRASEEPFFLWVHFYDPHMPLRPPARLLEETTPSSDGALNAFKRHLVRRHRSAAGRKIRSRIHKYDAEIRQVDEEMERLFGELADRGWGDRTLWLVTSDHGQGLGNHAWFGHHSRIYNVQLHVPLIFWLSGESLVPREVTETIAEHVDIPATILDLLGAEPPAQQAPVQGRSLAPVLSGAADSLDKRYAFAERRVALEGQSRREPGERFSVQNLRRKYIWFSAGTDEYYDLVADPYETTNLIDLPDESKDELRAALDELYRPLSVEGSAELVDEETLDRLKSLGYVD